MSKIRTTQGAAIVVAVVATAALSAAAPASSAATRSGVAETAQAAARLQCGTAHLEYRNWYHTQAYIQHSCTGTGTVQYDLTCVGVDTSVSYAYTWPGKSIRLPVSCSSPILGVDWTIK